MRMRGTKTEPEYPLKLVMHIIFPKIVVMTFKNLVSISLSTETHVAKSSWRSDQ